MYTCMNPYGAAGHTDGSQRGMIVMATLIEPSFADALAPISQATDLTQVQRRHWSCSLRVIAAALDKPTELVPARWTAIRQSVARLHHADLNMTAKTLANHKANIRAALRWFAKEAGIPTRGVPLSPDWARLQKGIGHFRTRANLSSLMRYCSARRVGPGDVNERVLDDCLAYRARTAALSADAAARRRIARAWNGCIGVVQGWPSARLDEPPPKRSSARPPWEEFPDGLRQDIESYLQRLMRVRRDVGGKRRLPCKPKTIAVRRAKLLAFVRKAVAIGYSIETLTSFSVVLEPRLVERVLDAYWQKQGEEPGIYAIELAQLLSAIAAQTQCIGQASIASLDDMRAGLEQLRSPGLTEKNMKLVRQVLGSDVWHRVIELPWKLMKDASTLRDRSPVKAAGLAQIAVAIAILTVFPIRVSNLGSIRTGENLTRPGAAGSPYWLHFPHYDVKNRVRLETVFDDAEMTRLLDEYIYKHLTVLLRGSNEPWLFPGLHGRPKALATLSGQITKRIHKSTGLQVTVHQFRHAAVALILTEKPGNYEYVRRILGHRNIQTTINFYVGLEPVQATKEFGDIIRRQMRFEVDAA